MADINIFIYKKGHSILHKINSSIKIIITIIFSIIIAKGSSITLIISGAVLFWGLLHSKIGIKTLFNRFLLIVLPIFLIMAPFYTIKLIELLLLGTIFVGTTKPQDIATGIFTITRNSTISKNLALTINLIPTFLISWREIETTLNSRGIYLRKNPFVIMKNIAIPLLIETFRKADNISIAMESRCYETKS